MLKSTRAASRRSCTADVGTWLDDYLKHMHTSLGKEKLRLVVLPVGLLFSSLCSSCCGRQTVGQMEILLGISSTETPTHKPKRDTRVLLWCFQHLSTDLQESRGCRECLSRMVSASSFTPTPVLPNSLLRQIALLVSDRVDLILLGRGKSNATILGQYFWQQNNRNWAFGCLGRWYF